MSLQAVSGMPSHPFPSGREDFDGRKIGAERLKKSADSGRVSFCPSFSAILLVVGCVALGPKRAPRRETRSDKKMGGREVRLVGSSLTGQEERLSRGRPLSLQPVAG